MSQNLRFYKFQYVFSNKIVTKIDIKILNYNYLAANFSA